MEEVADNSETQVIYVYNESGLEGGDQLIDQGDLQQLLAQAQQSGIITTHTDGENPGSTIIVTEAGGDVNTGIVMTAADQIEATDASQIITEAQPEPMDQQQQQQQQQDLQLQQESQPEDKLKPAPDLSKPITLTDETIVVINGKKCVLRVEANSGQLCAFPVQPAPGKRKRGRPPRHLKPTPTSAQEATNTTITTGSESSPPPPGDSVSTPGQPEDQAVSTPASDRSAAEGLLELSNTEGLRRSSRKRKRAKIFKEYATPEDVSDLEDKESDEGEYEGDDTDFSITGSGGEHPKLKMAIPRLQAQTAAGFTPPVKKGRGRPRRYPRPGESTPGSSATTPLKSPGPIPAFIIPTPTGQTIMMAPIEGLQHLQAYQQAKQTTPGATSILPKPAKILPKPAGEGGEDPDTVQQHTEGEETAEAVGTLTGEVQAEEVGDPVEAASKNLNEDKEVENGEKEDEDEENEEEDGEEGDEAEGEDGQVEKSKKRGRKAGWNKEAASKLPGPSTVIALPNNIFPMLLPAKAEPIKIGLKATESELEKFKCPKCDFQGYYKNQYQNHIATHTEDIVKCKCCGYLSFDPEDVNQHFKVNHPRCYCEECGFMADHAYQIKRHKMRHNNEGSECEICGKKYKDQYILKMHIKMVHMPAEVLYECNVCSKKFTRKAHLKRHMRIHDPEKPFKCPQCDYRGCEKSDITKHLLIHEEPKHVCEVCKKAFRHLKNKELHVKRHKGQRDYKCGVCDFYGYTFTDIRKHIERKHSQSATMTVACDRCGAPFRTEAALRDHQKICELTMIEQALAVATSTGNHTIQISDAQIITDGTQLTIDGTQVSIVEGEIAEGEIQLTEEQLVQAHMAVNQEAADHGAVAMVTGDLVSGDEAAVGIEGGHQEGTVVIPGHGDIGTADEAMMTISE
ncbi:zinc finger and BTB domain-containing protein 17 [Lingula anatina]|uniref:Zinc finger and BTB domain-containing protein 17 n=1 Tax=Lingula anatina TaxID=7574 RepID=A0A1S3JJT5_LINAN|nr:zinc finger and BTB domain-containing protein 17 [Lingula anatina]|eukprot:XP_013410675.1 zinc finger and BTB domain-containing protein 17 [Lingula anatina]